MRLCPWSLSMCNPTPILYTSFKPKMTAGAETPSPEFSRPFGQQIAHPLATWHNKVDSHGFPMEGKRPGSTGRAWAFTFHRKSVRIYFVVPSCEWMRDLLAERSREFRGGCFGAGGHFRLEG